MLDGFPGFDLIFECVNEVFFGEGFIFCLVYFGDEVFLFDHFAGDYFI